MKAPEYTVTLLKQEGGKTTFQAHPPKAHHFNIDAPQSLRVKIGEAKVERKTPSKNTEGEIQFEIASAKAASLVFSLYLCDDAKTFCEKREIAANWNGKELQLASLGQELVSGLTPEPKKPAKKTSAKIGKNQYGFLFNLPEQAFAEAKKQGKPLLIEFATSWCPICRRLEQFAFPAAEFQKAAKGFVKLRLDGDEDISYPMKNKSKLLGYPTTLFLTADGEEISRVVGYGSFKKYVKAVQSAWINRDRPFASLKSKADQGDTQAAADLGTAYLDQGEFELAETYLKKGGPAVAEKLADAQAGLVEKKSPDELMVVLEKAIQDFPNSVDSLYRRAKLAGLYESKGKKDLQKKTALEAYETAKKLISNHPERIDSHADAGDILGTIADSLQSMGDEKAALEAWKLAANELQKEYTKYKDPGHGLDLAYFLTEAGDTQGAEKIYKDQQSKFPEDFVFYMAYGKLKFKQKDFAQAEDYTTRALKLSYGENRLKVVRLLVQILKETGKKKEALDLIHRTQQTVELPEKPTAGTQRVLDSLEKMKKELSA